MRMKPIQRLGGGGRSRLTERPRELKRRRWARRLAYPESGDVTRHVKPSVQYMLWGIAAGRCEFNGCNKPLWKSSVTQEQVNLAEKAHIYSFSGEGPRGNEGITDEQLNDLPNLMLVCPECHAEMDKRRDGGRYTAELLKEWKAAHERRIEIVTGIDPLTKSHLVFTARTSATTARRSSMRELPHPSSPIVIPRRTGRSNSV